MSVNVSAETKEYDLADLLAYHAVSSSVVQSAVATVSLSAVWRDFLTAEKSVAYLDCSLALSMVQLWAL